MLKKYLYLVILAVLVSSFAQAMPFEEQLNLPKDYRAKRITKLHPVKPGETRTLLELEEAGCINHIWMTTNKRNDFRKITLRMYWDGESDPSVEAPLADFFGVGHNRWKVEEPFSTPCLVFSPFNGYNCYFPMPFRRSAKITITNEQDIDVIGWVYFQADYRAYQRLPKDVPYFHAQWRRESPALRRARPFTVIQAVGEGFLAGMTYHIRVDDPADNWCHGGGDTVYLDAETRPDCINGIGGEDYFSASWGIAPFISPYAGCPVNEEDEVMSMYRFYLEMPIPFERSVRLAFGTMANEITGVGYWYQTEPHQRYTTYPAPNDRLPESPLAPGTHDVELLSEDQLTFAVIGPFAGDIDTELDPEQKIDFQQSLKTNYKGPYKTDHYKDDDRLVRWEQARTTLGWLDFEALYKPKMTGPTAVRILHNCVAYAYLRMHSDRARSCEVRLGYDDPTRVWLNGKQVADLPQEEGFAGATVKLKLQKGWNDLLFKVSNQLNSNWSVFAGSVWFPKRRGLTFDDFAELPPAPEYARTAEE